MEINIKRTAAEEAALNKMKRGLDANKTNIRILALSALGVILLVFGSNNLNVENGYGGLLFIGASLMLYYQTHIKGIVRIKPITASPKKNDVAENMINLKFDDSFIVMETDKRYIQIKWSVVNSYRLYKDCLLILTGKEYKSAFVVKRHEISESEFTELSNFLAEKLEVLHR